MDDASAGNTRRFCHCNRRTAYGKGFYRTGISGKWNGTWLGRTGLEEKGYDQKTGRMLVCVNPAWFRPTDVNNLLGDPTKARTVLGWNPQKTGYEELVRIMAEHDRLLAKKEAMMKAGVNL